MKFSKYFLFISLFSFFNSNSRIVYLPEHLIIENPHISVISAFIAGALTNHVYNNGSKVLLKPLVSTAQYAMKNRLKTALATSLIAGILWNAKKIENVILTRISVSKGGNQT